MAKKSNGDSLARASSAALTSEEEKEAAALDALSDFFDTVDVDGMEDVGGDDLRLSVKLWNMKGLDKNGEAYKRNVFFDTISEETDDTIEAVLLVSQKTLRWDEYDNAKEETVVHCSSRDRITGTMADGTLRDCAGCPDTGWFRNEKGEPVRRCGPVHNVIAIEWATKRPFFVRFRKTALKPFRNYLMRHHFGARMASDGSRKNVPLFAFRVTLTLKMHESGNYALPVLTRGDVLSREEARAMHENAKAFLEAFGDVLAHADTVDAKHAGAATADPNLSAGDFAD